MYVSAMLLLNVQSIELPRERLQKIGVNSLSFQELLQLILGSGSKDNSVTSLTANVLNIFPDAKSLVNASFQELCAIPGLGTAKASALMASIELGLRLRLPKDIPYKITSPKDVFNLVHKDLVFKNQEVFLLLTLDSRNRVISKDIVAIGGISSVSISVREILQVAFKRNAASIIICHNHPSNDPTPSKEDEDVTNKLYQACNSVEIPLIDHIVVGGESYVSLKALGFFEGNIVKKKGGDNE